MSIERAVPGAASWPELAAPHLARYFFAADYARGRRVLDAGCGSGYGARILQAAGAAHVLAVDIDPATVAQAQAQYGGPGIEFQVDDCQELSRITPPVDLICNFENIEHIQRPELFLAAAGRCLSPEGLLLVSSPDRRATPPFVDGRPRNPFHVHEWYAEEFADLLRAHFDSVELRVQIESLASVGRRDAVAALRQGLLWCNPLAIFLWRKLPGVAKSQRGWKRLEQLAAPGAGDFPIVDQALAPLLGQPAFHVALCRGARNTER